MPTKRLSTELLVIGGGTAGLRIAMQAADHGYKTILCEGAEVGGTCLNRGCIPTKALLQASHTYRVIHEAKALGITATPRLNGKVERSHRIDAEEFYRVLDGVVIDDTALFNDKLQEWEDFYNFNRPHCGLDGQTPYERLKQKTQNPV